MSTLRCHACGKVVKIGGAAAGAKSACPCCGARLATSARPPIVEAIPVAEEAAPQPTSTLSRVGFGALKGLGLPFLFAFVIACEMGLNALLGIENTSRNTSPTLVSRGTGLRMVFVGLIALLAVIGGAVAGNAMGGVLGAVIGAGVGYIVGSMSGGAIVELLAGPRPAKDGAE